MSVKVYFSPNNDPYVASYTLESAPTSNGAPPSGTWSFVASIAHDLSGSNYDNFQNLFFYTDTAGTDLTWYRVKSVDSLAQSSPYSTPFQAAGIDPSLASLAELKLYLNIPTTTTTDDELLKSLLLAASNWFEGQTGRKIQSALYTETYNGDGTQRLNLYQDRVTEVLSVIVDEIEIPPRTNSTSSDGYYWMGRTVYMDYGHWVAPYWGHTWGQNFTEGMGNVKVVYVAGYASVPYDIRQAVIWQAGNWYRERTRIGVMNSSVGGENISYQTLTLPVHVQATIDAYKRLPRF